MSNDLILYDFFGVSGRCVKGHDGEPWYVAKDACDTLEIRNVAHALGRLDDDEKADIVLNDTRSGQRRRFSIVSKSGLRALILFSRKGKAREYRKWVTSEVLPAIEKHGFYVDERRLDEVPALIRDAYLQFKAVVGREPRGGVTISPHDGAIVECEGSPIMNLAEYKKLRKVVGWS